MPPSDAEAFLRLAERLVAQDQSEAAYRTAISRAYYACHLVGRESTWLRGWFNPTLTGADHAGLIRVLNNRVTWYRELDRLRRLRERADYHIEAVERARGPIPCEFCALWRVPSNLVTDRHWGQAQSLAAYVLPHLRQITPMSS